jgi:hypothetical protein
MNENNIIAFCGCCGLAIYTNDTYTKIDGEYYCDYCGGEDGLSISEMCNNQLIDDLMLEQSEQM